MDPDIRMGERVCFHSRQFEAIPFGFGGLLRPRLQTRCSEDMELSIGTIVHDKGKVYVRNTVGRKAVRKSLNLSQPGWSPSGACS